MTEYHIFLNESLKINDSIITHLDIRIFLTEVLHFITSLGGLIS